MAVKIGINGFGRIGRMVLRIAAERPETIEVCGINLRKADLDYMVYLMKYDSVFGRFPGTIEEGENCLIINGKQVGDTVTVTVWRDGEVLEMEIALIDQNDY